MTVARRGHAWWMVTEVLHDMMGRGADINVQTYDGRTPLMIAAGTSDRQTREALVKLLLTELGTCPPTLSEH
jgi:ankyrin repeat protein